MAFKLLSVVTLGLHVALGLDYTDNGIAIVGTTEPLNIDVTAGTSREDLISYEFSSYIAVHFAGFDLPEGDSVVISSPDAQVTVSHTYTGRGRDQSGTFIASFISGNSVTVKYNSVGAASTGQGYRITGFSRGYPTKQEESVCGDGDQSLPAKCYAPGTNLSEELPQAYRKAQAVARLLINGTYLCTGWLGGSEGHVFTNHHCFDQEDWALTTDIEFMAESSSCSDQCERQLGCAGKIVATTSTLIADSEDIDYSVIQLPDCVDLSPYGYLQLRESGPVLNESIYVPQHPDGYAKRIVSTVDGGDNTTIRSVGQDGACGTDQVGHDADTKGGSSGSPLIAASDNLVVAIHHCGGCTNTAIDVRTVLTDLASKNITIKNLVASQDVSQSSPPLYAQTTCAAQQPNKSTHTGHNQTTPCTHSTKRGSNTTAVSTTATNSSTTSNVTTSNSTTTSTASKSTPMPALISTTSSTTTSKSTTALTSDSVVTSTKSATDTSTGGKRSSTPVTTTTSSSSNTTSSTISASSNSTSTTVTTWDVVGKLKAAVVGATSPVSTPSATKASLTSKPAFPAPTPASTVASTVSPSTASSVTLSPTVSRTPSPTTTNPSTASPTPATTVTSIPTSAPTMTSTPKPSTAAPTLAAIPAPTATSTHKPCISSPAPTTITSTASPTPASTLTSTTKPITTNPPSTPVSTPASTTTSSSGDWGDVEQN